MKFGVGGVWPKLPSKFILDCSPKHIYCISFSNWMCLDTGNPDWGFLFVHQTLLGQCPRPFTYGSIIQLLWLQLLVYQSLFSCFTTEFAANSSFHTVWSLWPHCVKSFICLSNMLWWCKHGGSLCRSPKEGYKNFLPYSTIFLLLIAV